MSFLEACEMVYPGIIRMGNPGIYSAGDTGDAWVFGVEPKNPDEVEYGIHPRIVYKDDDINVHVFDPFDPEDLELLERAAVIDVPEKYKREESLKLLNVVNNI